MAQQPETTLKSTATISDCGKYRYTLSRVWDMALPQMGFVMLNPSTADADTDDPTIRKCIGFAKRGHCGGINVVNLFAFRATDPADLRKAGYPCGPDNDAHIARAMLASHSAVCAWGANARNLARPAEVLALLRKLNRHPVALRLLAGNVPAHPLMLPYTCDLQPMPYNA
jgi:hypothetical protein